jgi:hypothetical protein
VGEVRSRGLTRPGLERSWPREPRRVRVRVSHIVEELKTCGVQGS